MKKTWQAPQLIVLVRSKSAEAVLVSCKAGTANNMWPDVDDSSCQWQACSYCSAQETS